jgi:hypothetical protein
MALAHGPRPWAPSVALALGRGHHWPTLPTWTLPVATADLAPRGVGCVEGEFTPGYCDLIMVPQIGA